MSMKVTKLTTYWNADEAYDILSLLDRLSEALWETYGDDIIEREIAQAKQLSLDDQALALDDEYANDRDVDFDSDDIPF